MERVRNSITFISQHPHVSVLVLFAALTPNLVYAFGLELGVLLLQWTSVLTGFAGVLLNLAVVHLVIDMGGKFTENFGLTIETIWAIIRDLMNMLFIFGLIYIGFRIILDVGSGAAKKMIPLLIIAALLINFSLFFTKVIVDVSNSAAIEIFGLSGFAGPIDSATGDPIAYGTGADFREPLVAVGVSGAFMDLLGLKDLLAPSRETAEAEAQFDQILQSACNSGADESISPKCTVEPLVFFFTAIIFMLVAAYAFILGAVMLVWRFLVLIFLMIFSPLMFAGWILPALASYQRKWWSQFLAAAFFAPAYIFMLYLAYAVGGRVGVQNDGDALFLGVSGQVDSIDVVLNFVIVIGFLIAAVQVGKSMSFYGSRATIGLVDNVRDRGKRVVTGAAGYAAGGALGGAGYLGRQTIGKGAYKASQNQERVQLAQGKGLRSWIARRQLDAAEAVSKKSFDARQSMGKKAQSAVGTGQKGGYAQKISDVEKKQKDLVKRYGSNDAAVFKDYGVEDQLKQYKKLEKDRGEAEKELASLKNTPEFNERRKELIETIRRTSGEIKNMEKGGATREQREAINNRYKEWDSLDDYVAKNGTTLADGSTITIDKFNKLKEQKLKDRENEIKSVNQKFADAKKAEKGYGARKFATNYENALSGVPKRLRELFIDETARKAGAKAVKKANPQKGNDQKLLDEIKEFAKNNEDAAGGESTPPAPDSTGGGSSSGTT